MTPTCTRQDQIVLPAVGEAPDMTIHRALLCPLLGSCCALTHCAQMQLQLSQNCLREYHLGTLRPRTETLAQGPIHPHTQTRSLHIHLATRRGCCYLHRAPLGLRLAV